MKSWSANAARRNHCASSTVLTNPRQTDKQNRYILKHNSLLIHYFPILHLGTLKWSRKTNTLLSLNTVSTPCPIMAHTTKKPIDGKTWEINGQRNEFYENNWVIRSEFIFFFLNLEELTPWKNRLEPQFQSTGGNTVEDSRWCSSTQHSNVVIDHNSNAI